MSSFKYKPEKLKYLSNINTLDELHKKQVADFNYKKMQIPNKKAELRKLNANLLEMQKKELCDVDDIRKKSNIKEKIEEITEDLYELENGLTELDYYSRTGDILLEYYNIVDDSCDSCDSCDSHFNIIDESDNAEIAIEKTKISQKLVELNLLSQQKRKIKKPTRKRAKRLEEKPKQNILSFFSRSSDQKQNYEENNTDTCTETETGIETETETETETASNIAENIPVPINSTTINPTNNDENVQSKLVDYDQYTDVEKLVSNKATLFDEYMMMIDRAYVSSKLKSNPIRLCLTCGIEKTLIQSEGSYVCQKCGETEHIIVESEIPNHKDATSEKPKYPYKRLLNIWVLIAVVASLH